MKGMIRLLYVIIGLLIITLILLIFSEGIRDYVLQSFSIILPSLNLDNLLPF